MKLMSAEFKQTLGRFYADEYDRGYSLGRRGKPYNGTMWHGYYGWLHGKRDAGQRG